MEQRIIANYSEYTQGDTGLNKAGLFARVSPGVTLVNLVRGLRFTPPDSRLEAPADWRAGKLTPFVK